MDFIGSIGFSLASAAYALFTLLVVAARNSSLLARWVLFCTLITFGSNLVAALQIKDYLPPAVKKSFEWRRYLRRH